MKNLTLALISTCIAVSFTAIQAYPRGNYNQSCNSCVYRHHNLSCSCRRANHFYPGGLWQRSTLHDAKHCAYVQNFNGRLTCTKWKHRRYHRHHYRNVRITAGPIWNNMDANVKCPTICGNAGGRWTGQWNTVQEAVQSVCQCKVRVY